MKHIASIRHVDLVVNSLTKSLDFYRGLLQPLGWQVESEIKGERDERLVYIAGPQGFADGAIGLRERQSHATQIPYDRYDIGVHHIALNAETRDAVDERAEWLKNHGYEIESGPDLYYNDNYYAVFFYDPDGIKLEVVCGN